jgi:DNA-binding transcriptional regulator GbsR (MarR family)
VSPPKQDLSPVIRRIIEDAGNTTQSLGVGRVLGQIFAYLYFTPQPQGLTDLQGALGISKGSASMGVRQLEQWNAVRKVWVRGDRKDYYEANDWLGEIVRNVLRDTVGSKLLASSVLLDDDLEEKLHDALGDTAETEAFLSERISNLRKFQKKTEKVWQSPLVKMLLK